VSESISPDFGSPPPLKALATGVKSQNDGKSPNPAGKHEKDLEHGSSNSAGNFPMISGRVLSESTGCCWNPPKKIRKIQGRNTASNFLVFSVVSRPFPAVRHSSGKLYQTLSSAPRKCVAMSVWKAFQLW
jgi:hypothetical protein